MTIPHSFKVIGYTYNFVTKEGENRGELERRLVIA